MFRRKVKIEGEAIDMNKMLSILSAAAAAALMAGCATRSVSTAAVGPNAASVAVAGPNGQLEVFSDYSTRSEGSNPTWRQHSDYYIYTSDGRLLDYVANAPGYYSSLPRLVQLPAGKYIVKARAKGALWTTVPVVIKPHQITRVHLDGNWQAGAPEP
jgi:hypothetical protein